MTVTGFRTGEHPAPPDHLPRKDHAQRCNALANGYFCTLPKHLDGRSDGWTEHEAGVMTTGGPTVVAWWIDPTPDKFKPL